MSASAQTVLCLNGGSSSLKFAAYEIGVGEPRVLMRGAVERIGSADTTMRLWADDGTPAAERRVDVCDLGAAAALALGSVAGVGVELAAAGHRIVHGGPHHLQPVRIDEAVLTSLRTAIPFAPLHLPGELALIAAIRAQHPSLPQVACFDTAFHASLPLVAQRLPLPSSLWHDGVRRYGFHGLSYESIVRTLGPLVAGRTIVAHLGNGASMVALQDGIPLDTTMGFTPCGGLIMGTRSGDLDPGVVVHLMRARGMNADTLETVLNRESGLLALSETASDMRALLAARATDTRAALAIAMFCLSARKWIGALTAVLGGLDTLVFTGGIGEHAAVVREEICRELAHLGVEIDRERNARSDAVVTAVGSGCTVRVVPTDEELQVARHTARLAFAVRTAPAS